MKIGGPYETRHRAAGHATVALLGFTAFGGGDAPPDFVLDIHRRLLGTSLTADELLELARALKAQNGDSPP